MPRHNEFDHMEQQAVFIYGVLDLGNLQRDSVKMSKFSGRRTRDSTNGEYVMF